MYATPTTAELVGVVLPDCAHLQEEEADHANRTGYSKHDPALPLYTQDDAWRAVERLNRSRSTPSTRSPPVSRCGCRVLDTSSAPRACA